MYSSRIFEIFKNPTNAGGLQGANAIGKYTDETCGDCVKLYLKVDDNKIIKEARFKTMGSVGTIVASSAVCSAILDVNIDDLHTITKKNITMYTGEYPESKEYSINFVLNALTLASKNYYEKLEKEEKKGIKPSKIVVEEQEETSQQQPVQEELIASEAMEQIAKAQAEGLISEEENNKASSILEGARSYTPVVETKILSDEDLKKLEEKRNKNKTNVSTDKSVSSVKAMFDAMFED